MNNQFRILFISGKLGDVDGVSLEVEKWIGVLSDLGHQIYAAAGTFAHTPAGIPEEHCLEIPEIRFTSDDQRYYEQQTFPHMNRYKTAPPQDRIAKIREELNEKGHYLADILFEFIQQNSIDVLIAQNTNAMPMTLLGGMAVYLLAVEKRMAVIFHHHDFWWERSRFSDSYLEDLLSRTMPPKDPGLEHVVLTSYAAHILRSIKRVEPRVIPNCEDFTTPVCRDSYNSDFRRELGFADDDILFVQPTRIIPRKRIEDSVRLLARLGEYRPEFKPRLKLVISLYQGDEPDQGYIDGIRRLAGEQGVSLHFISERVAARRGRDDQGRKLYTNRDVLVQADFATYLPIWEGFGNALLEAIAARVPVITSTYLVYKTDIRIRDFRNIEIPDYYDEENRLVIPDAVLDEIGRLWEDPAERERRAEHNFRVGASCFSLGKLREYLLSLLEDYSYEILASRKRIKKSGRGFSV